MARYQSYMIMLVRCPIILGNTPMNNKRGVGWFSIVTEKLSAATHIRSCARTTLSGAWFKVLLSIALNLQPDLCLSSKFTIHFT